MLKRAAPIVGAYDAVEFDDEDRYFFDDAEGLIALFDDIGAFLRENACQVGDICIGINRATDTWRATLYVHGLTGGEIDDQYSPTSYQRTIRYTVPEDNDKHAR